MPSIDLARLRKQALRLIDFFFVPDEFVRYLATILDSYDNYTMRKRQALAPGLNLPSHRTPNAVMKQIEHEMSTLASQPENADATLALADRLWEEDWLEPRLLAAFLLGRIPPHGGRLIARLTAWTSQARDMKVRRELVGSSLERMREEAPGQFLDLVSEWLRPERTQYWPDAIRASISAVKDPEFTNLPPLLDVLEPVVIAAPSQIQLDLADLILALYQGFPTETIYFVNHVLSASNNPMTPITFRRMLPAFPSGLRQQIRDLLSGRLSPMS